MTEEFSEPAEAIQNKYGTRHRYRSYKEFGSSHGKKSKSSDVKGANAKSVLIGLDHVEVARYPENLFYPEPEMEDAVGPEEDVVEASEAEM